MNSLLSKRKKKTTCAYDFSSVHFGFGVKLVLYACRAWETSNALTNNQ